MNRPDLPTLDPAVGLARPARPGIPSEVSQLVWSRAEHSCQKCAKREPEVSLEIAHIIPWRKCQTHEPHNLALLCFPCHREWDALEARGGVFFTQWLAGDVPPEPQEPKSATVRRPYKLTITLSLEELEAIEALFASSCAGQIGPMARSILLQCADAGTDSPRSDIDELRMQLAASAEVFAGVRQAARALGMR